MIRPPPRSPLFPSTTLFRSVGMCLAHDDIRALGNAQSIWIVNDHMDGAYPYPASRGAGTRWGASAIAGLLVEGDRADPGHKDRSEEHTSELQSQSNLVCRLL